MSIVYGRSDIEIAEDILLATMDIAQSRMISRETAVRTCRDISCNKKYVDIISSIENLIERQDQMPSAEWTKAAFKFQFTFY